jgi:predicted AAA+ superfamily ATPase
MTAVFHREEEFDALRRRVAARKSALLHGPSGVGKTLLLDHLMPDFPHLLNCPQSSSSQAVFRSLAEILAHKKDTAMLRALGGRPAEAIRQKTAVSLKGIVISILCGKQYMVVLDHLHRPSHSFATMVRELMISYSVPVVAVARSAHMEDAGFVAPLFPDRADKLEIKNFDSESAKEFAKLVAKELNLRAENLDDFLTRLVEFSEGNPGAIARMINMATMSKYRVDGHIIVSPLYIDFRLRCAAAASE